MLINPWRKEEHLKETDSKYMGAGGERYASKRKYVHEMGLCSFLASGLNWGPQTSKNMRNHNQKCYKEMLPRGRKKQSRVRQWVHVHNRSIQNAKKNN